MSATESIELEEFEGFKCQECEEVTESFESPLYECNNCGSQFTRGHSANDNHQCPDCNKFASKIAEAGCEECGSGELTEFSAWYCPECEEYFERVNDDEDMPHHNCVEEEEKRVVMRKSEIQAKIDTIEFALASELIVGDKVYSPDSENDDPFVYFAVDRPRYTNTIWRITKRDDGQLNVNTGTLGYITRPEFKFMIEKRRP